MLAIQAVEGEGSGQPSKPQPIPSPAPSSHEEPILASGSPPEKVNYEAIHKELGDIVEGATTTAANLDVEQDSGNILKPQSTEIPNVPLSQGIGIGGGNTLESDEERLEQDDLTNFVPPTPHDSPLLGGYTHGSDEGRPNINELMAIYANLSNKVLALETSKTAQDLVIKKRKSLDKENVSKQGRNLKTRPMFEEGDFDDDFDDIDDMENEARENVEGYTVNTSGAVNTATTGVSAASASVTITGVFISTAKPRTPLTTTTTVFEDKDLTIAQTLVKMRSEGIMQEPEKPLKNPRKAQIQMDEEMAMRLHEEDNAELERIMDADALLAPRLQEEEREQFSINEQAIFLVETIAERKRFTYNKLKNKSLEEIQKLYEREQK
ncbi:hypothetical protein Tco_0913134 [Tanacetum coccineum]